MSNLEKDFPSKPPVNFYQEQNYESSHQQELKQTDANIKKELNDINFNTNIKTEIHKKPYECCNDTIITEDNSSSKTILITTHNYSSQIPKSSSRHICSDNNNSSSSTSSSSITIVTTHNSDGSVSGTKTSTINDQNTSKSNGDCIVGSCQNRLNSHSNNNQPVVLEGINILINNHFSSEPNSNSNMSSESFNSTTNSTLSSTTNIINIKKNNINDLTDQKKHINSTSLKDKEQINNKSEISDTQQTEPDSTTSGLSPDKTSFTKSSMASNSDTGFSSSSSSFCSSNSSNSSCISNDGTNHNNNNNNYKPNVYNFTKNMDVLVQKKDGKFYLGIIKEVYAVDGKCLVNFDDNSEYLADFDELKKLGSSSENDSTPMCVVCKKIDKNDIVESCEKCLRGFHRMCAEGGYKNGIWTCKLCSTENGIKTPEKKQISASTNQQTSRIVKLPYDIKSLSWDNKHRINAEETYCYCGKYGRWDIKMLQCVKCLQWFHEKCIKCLLHPLLMGDRFYVFICCCCNNGNEFIRRLKVSWIDLVHILLYNLTKLENDKRYHHLNKVLIPYAIRTWTNLQLSPMMSKLSDKEIRRKIINVLNNCSRFKNGKENNKSSVYWGLRTCIPPAVPKIVIPRGTTKITDEFLKSVLKLRILTPLKQLKRPHMDSEDDPYTYDSDSKFSGDLKFSSEDEIPIKNIIEKEKRSSLENKSENDEQKKQIKEQNKVQNEQQSKRKKKSIFYPRLPNLNDGKNGDNNLNGYNALNHILNNINDKSSVVSSTDINNLCCDSSDDNSSLGTLDLRIPPPKNFFGRNNPFRQTTPKKNQNQINQKFNNKKLGAMCAPKFNSNGGNNKSIDLNSKLVALKKSSVNLFNGVLPSEIQAAGQFRIVRTIKRRLSAKDLVIGPNQEIKKRRLKRASSSGNGNVEVISTSIQTLSSCKSKNNNIIATYPVGKSFNLNPLTNSNLLTAPITSVNISSGSGTSPDGNKTFSNFVNSQATQRNLRKRDDVNYTESRRNSISGNGINNCLNTSENDLSRNNSFEQQQIKQQSHEDELSDLQSSVNMYFGPVQRIRNGEKFIVHGKRTLSNGKVQYLMEWDVSGQASQ